MSEQSMSLIKESIVNVTPDANGFTVSLSFSKLFKPLLAPGDKTKIERAINKDESIVVYVETDKSMFLTPDNQQVNEIINKVIKGVEVKITINKSGVESLINAMLGHNGTVKGERQEGDDVLIVLQLNQVQNQKTEDSKKEEW